VSEANSEAILPA